MAESIANVRVNTADFKGVMLFDEEPDWELVTSVTDLVARREGLFIFPLATTVEEDGSTWVDVIGRDVRAGRASLPSGPRDLGETGGRSPMDFAPHILSLIRRRFGCEASVAPIVGDLLHPDDLRLEMLLADRGNSGLPASEVLSPVNDWRPQKPAATAPAATAEHELDSLVGLADVKRRLKEIVAFAAKNAGNDRPCLHMVFRGNPGTGKTTVARILGRMLGEVGVLEHPEHFVECDRAGLVGEYVGHTAQKTLGQIERAKGGVLFVDEAYALGMYGGLGAHHVAADECADFGDEALSTLVKAMEDHRGDFVCIMAGYTRSMDRMISRNPGLRDRVAFYIDFPDYSPAELTQIFRLMAGEKDLELDADAEDVLETAFARMTACDSHDFSNGRMVRKVFERCLMRQATMRDDRRITAGVVRSALSDTDLASEVGESRMPVGFCA